MSGPQCVKRQRKRYLTYSPDLLPSHGRQSVNECFVHGESSCSHSSYAMSAVLAAILALVYCMVVLKSIVQCIAMAHRP